MRLALPPDLVPSVDQGFVTLVATGAIRSQRWKDSLRHWDLELGGQTRVVVRLSRHDFLRENRPLTLVRQSLTYEFSPRGMQLSADLKLDVLGEPIQRIALLVDQPLALVTARYGGTQLPWIDTDPAAKGPRRIVLDLPEPLHGTGRVVRLGFVAPLVLHGRSLFGAPATTTTWQEGRIALVPLPPELDEPGYAVAAKLRRGPLPTPAVGDAIGLQYFRPDADVAISIERRAEQLRVNSGTMIEVRGGTMTGRSQADITAQSGECFELSANVSPSWIIDSVESIPADSLADWSYSAGNGPSAQLHVSLAKSIRPSRPLRLLVSGRWRRAPRGEQLRPKDLEMVTLRGVTAERRRRVIRFPSAVYRLQTAGADELLHDSMIPRGFLQATRYCSAKLRSAPARWC